MKHFRWFTNFIDTSFTSLYVDFYIPDNFRKMCKYNDIFIFETILIIRSYTLHKRWKYSTKSQEYEMKGKPIQTKKL